MKLIEWLLPISGARIEDLKKSSLASIRLRAAVCAEEIQGKNFKTIIEDGRNDTGSDVVIVGKPDFANDSKRSIRWLKYIESASIRGARVIIDYTDHHLDTHTELDRFYGSSLTFADAVICSSKKLSEYLRPYYSGQIAIIEDPIEVPIVKSDWRTWGNKTALWVGHSSNLPYLIEFLCNDYSLVERLQLIIMTNAYPLPRQYVEKLNNSRLSKLEISVVPWNLEDMISAASISETFWIPAGIGTKRKSGASSNRLITALALGLPVAADELDSYMHLRAYFSSIRTMEFNDLMKNPMAYSQRVTEAQVYIENHYHKSVIGKQWRAFLEI
jgi:hypothetical protein